MNFINDFKNIDISIIKVMKNGFKFSFILCLIATYILYLYSENPTSHVMFEVGFSMAKCSIVFFVCFFIGAFTSNKIKKAL